MKKFTNSDLSFFEKILKKVKDNKWKWFIGAGVVAAYIILKYVFKIDIPSEILTLIM